MFIYFYPLALQRWNTSAVQIGGVLSLIGVTMAVVQVPAGILSDRFGSRPLLRAAWAMGLAATLIMAAAQTLPVFVAGLLVYGFTSFVSAPLSSYVTSQRGSWSVERALTFVSASMHIGAIAGPMFGGWIGTTMGLPMVFQYAAVLFLISTTMIFLVRRPVQKEQEAAVHAVSPLANPRFIGLLLVIFLSIFAMNMPQQLTAMYLQDVHGLSIQEIGATGTIASLSNAFFMLLMGGLRAPVGMLLGQLLVAAFAFFMLRGQTAAVFIAGYFFLGGYRLYRSMALAFARPLVKSGDIGLAFGLVETGNALAVILAPLAAGFLYNYRPQAVYTASLIAIAVTVTINTFMLPRKRWSAQESYKVNPQEGDYGPEDSFAPTRPDGE